MITSGFKVNGTIFRIGRIALVEEPPVLVEGWSCRGGQAEVFKDPAKRLEIVFSFEPRLNATSMLRHITDTHPMQLLPPDVWEQFATVIERVFGGMAPSPARPEVVMQPYRECHDYSLSMVVHAIYLEIRANIMAGAPPISKTSIGVVRIPYAYEYVVKGSRQCCETGPDLPTDPVAEDDRLTEDDLKALGGLKPLSTVWRDALDLKDTETNGRPPKSGLLRPADEGDWELEEGSPSFGMGPD